MHTLFVGHVKDAVDELGRALAKFRRPLDLELLDAHLLGQGERCAYGCGNQISDLVGSTVLDAIDERPQLDPRERGLYKHELAYQRKPIMHTNSFRYSY